MRITKSFASAPLALVILFGPATASFSSNSGKFPDIPVTTTLNSSGDVNSGTNYRIQSDGNGSYFDGVSNVSSILQGAINNPSRDWILDTRNSTSRNVLIDLRSPLPNGAGKAPFAWQEVPARIIAMCHRTLNGSFPAIALNQTVPCPMYVLFDYAGTSFQLALDPTTHPETNQSLVTCTAANNANQCVGWTISPIVQPDSTVQNIAHLARNSNHNIKAADLGDFYVSFNIAVTNP